MNKDQKNNDIAPHPTVNILGVTYNTLNYGVWVLLSGTVQQLVRNRPSVRIHVLDYLKSAAIWDEDTEQGILPIEVINLRFSWRFYLQNNVVRLLLIAFVSRLIFSSRLRKRVLSANPWFKRIMEEKAHLSLAGCDSFSDIYGLQRFFYVSLPQILVLWLGKPLILLPQTYGPFKSRISRDRKSTRLNSS